MALTADEENFIKKLYIDHQKWLAADALNMETLSPEKYKEELEKISGKGFCDEPEIAASK